MQHLFTVLAPEYRRRLAALKITRSAQVTRRAEQILRRPEVIANFKPVEAALGIPMVWMICSFERESGLDFTRSPAQGDAWNRASVNVPRGVGPFKSFTDAALWSYRHDGIDKNSAPWTMTYACWASEKFNGFGPRDHGRVSGYLLAGTDQYDPPMGEGGKYIADGRWSGSTVDTQVGCVPLALELIRLEPSLAIVAETAPSLAILAEDAPSIITPTPIDVIPTPAGIGGKGEGIHDTVWVQGALNLLTIEGTPLLLDGSYGRKTRNAVRVFQSVRGLAPDGLAGPATCAALDQAIKDLKK